MSESINETYEETPQSAMQDILDRQRKAYLAEGVVSTATRVDRLERAIQVVKKHQKTFVEAMTQDFGHRSEHQSMFTDIASSVGPLRHARRRKNAKSVPAFWPCLEPELGSNTSLSVWLVLSALGISRLI